MKTRMLYKYAHMMSRHGKHAKAKLLFTMARRATKIESSLAWLSINTEDWNQWVSEEVYNRTYGKEVNDLEESLNKLYALCLPFLYGRNLYGRKNMLLLPALITRL